MHFHTQKVECIETLRFSFLPAMSTAVTSSPASQFYFSLHTCVLNVAVVLLQPVVLSWGATKEVNSKFVQHKATLTQLKKIPLVQLNLFRQKLILGSAFMNPWSSGFDPHCRTVSGTKMSNLQFSWSAFSNRGWSPNKLSFLSFFCPLEGELLQVKVCSLGVK